MKIGVDIDDTLLDFVNPFLNWVNQNYGTSLKKEEIKQFDLSNVMAEPENMINRFYNSPEFLGLTPILGAYETLQKHPDKEFIAITARRNSTLEQTLHQLKQFPMVKSVYMDVKKKGDFCKMMGVDLMIDDSSDNVYNCAVNTVPAVLYNQPWNETPFIPIWVGRANDWEEIDKWINLYT